MHKLAILNLHVVYCVYVMMGGVSLLYHLSRIFVKLLFVPLIGMPSLSLMDNGNSSSCSSGFSTGFPRFWEY